MLILFYLWLLCWAHPWHCALPKAPANAISASGSYRLPIRSVPSLPEKGSLCTRRKSAYLPYPLCKKRNK